MRVSSQIVKTARAALHLLTARGLPPTPENYARVYREISGESTMSSPDQEVSPETPLSVEQKLDNSRELVELIRVLVSAVSEQAEHLAVDLDQHSRSMRQSISDLQQTDNKQEIANLLQIILGTAQTLQNSVDEAQREITCSRQMLDHMREELQETRRQLLLDPLTGARNRFGMEASLGQEIARARRSEGKLAITMVDLDHFKKLNDEYGHEAGDLALVYFAQLCRAVLRESDTLYRYGGEEFLITLPETDVRGATFMLERLAQMLAKSPLHYKEHLIGLTFSAGLTCLKEGDTPQTLLARADAAMYRAKQEGRNRIVVDEVAT
ncbi:MAG: GGDEF domain-containing protein [Methylophilaceae bacterium]|nr:GGDEF domain-containing protein [Methylophilaceae bacterium]